jgi:hypothetical protein
VVLAAPEEPSSLRDAFPVDLPFIAALISTIGLRIKRDCLNHLDRYRLLAGGPSVSPTSSMFAIDWGYASTSVGANGVVALPAAVVPYRPAGELLLVGTFADPLATAGGLNQILFGRWT